jgi:hypothetical protein
VSVGGSGADNCYSRVVRSVSSYWIWIPFSHIYCRSISFSLILKLSFSLIFSIYFFDLLRFYCSSVSSFSDFLFLHYRAYSCFRRAAAVTSIYFWERSNSVVLRLWACLAAASSVVEVCRCCYLWERVYEHFWWVAVSVYSYFVWVMNASFSVFFSALALLSYFCTIFVVSSLFFIAIYSSVICRL